MKKTISRILCLAMLCTFIPGASISAAALDAYVWNTLPNNCSSGYTSIIDTSTALYSYDTMMDDIDTLVSAYSAYAHEDTVGYSELGRAIPALVIGDDQAPNRFLLTAGMHAREYVNVQILMKQAEFMLHNLSNSIYTGTSDEQTLSDLLDDCQFYFIPMANPDGIMLSQEGLDSLEGLGLDQSVIDAYTTSLTSLQETMNDTYVEHTTGEYDDGWTKPTSPDTDFTYWKSNIDGTDMHYNFYDSTMYEWLTTTGYLDKHPEHTDGAMYRDYFGTAAESASETAAIADYCRDKNFNIAISYHAVGGKDKTGTTNNSDSSDGGLVTWNYGFFRDLPDETYRTTRSAEVEAAADAIAGFMQYNAPDTYNGAIGFTGWHNHAFPRAFSAVVETGFLDWFDNTSSPDQTYDACPLDIGQITTDVTTTDARTLHCIWDRQMLAPEYMAKYIISTGNFGQIHDTTPEAPRFLSYTQDDDAVDISYDISSDIGGSAITDQTLYVATSNPDSDLSYSEVTSGVTHSGQTFSVTGISAGTYYYKCSLSNTYGESGLSHEYVTVNVHDFTGAEITGISYSGGGTSTVFTKSGGAGTLSDKCVIEKGNYSTGANLTFRLNYGGVSDIHTDSGATITFYSNPQCTTTAPTQVYINSSTPSDTFYAKVIPSGGGEGDAIYYKIILAKNLDKDNTINRFLMAEAVNTATGYYGESTTYPAVFQSIDTTENEFSPSDIVMNSENATVKLYAKSDFSSASEITDVNPAYIPGRNVSGGALNYFYVKCTSERGDVLYGKLLVSRYLSATSTQTTQLSKIVVSTSITYDYGCGHIKSPKTAIRGNFGDRTDADLTTDIAGYSGATVTFYTNTNYDTLLSPTTYSINSSNPEYVAYAKVVAGDSSTTCYYIIKIRHNTY